MSSSRHSGRAPGRMAGDEAWSNSDFRWRGTSNVQLRPRGGFYMRVRGLVQQWSTCAQGRTGALVWPRTSMRASVEHVAGLVEPIFSRVMSQIQARS